MWREQHYFPSERTASDWRWLAHKGTWQYMRRSVPNSAAIVRVAHFRNYVVSGTRRFLRLSLLLRLVLWQLWWGRRQGVLGSVVAALIIGRRSHGKTPDPRKTDMWDRYHTGPQKTLCCFTGPWARKGWESLALFSFCSVTMKSRPVCCNGLHSDAYLHI
jgi:hypothetical protein